MKRHHQRVNTTREPHYILIVILTVIYTVSYLDAIIILDGARDFYQTEQIVSGKSFPLQGPDLASTIHLGPWWFYWLSLIGIFQSKTLLTLWIGLCAGLKFGLAYLLGKKLIDARFGLCFVFALVLPGWQTVEQIIFTHVNVVPTLSLFFCLQLLLLWQTRQGERLKWLALIFTLSLHAHPTTYGLLLFALPFLVIMLMQKTFSRKQIVLAIVFGLAPIVPYVTQQALDGWIDLHRAGTYGDKQFTFARLNLTIDLFQSLFFNGAWLYSEVLAQGNRIVAVGLKSTVIFTLFLAVFGFIRGIYYHTIQYRRVALFTWALLSLLMCILVIRDVVPFYMAYILSPTVAIFIAYGIYLATMNWHCTSLVLSLLAITLLTTTWVRVRHVRKVGYLHQPNNTLNNILLRQTEDWQTNNYKFDAMSTSQAEKLGEYLCQHKHRQLHASVVPTLDLTLGMPILFECNKITLSGDSVGYALLSPSVWEDLPKLIFPKKIANYAVIDRVTPLKSVDFTLARVDEYQHPPRRHQIGKESVSVTRSLSHDSYVIVTNYLSVFQPFSTQVSINGQLRQPIASNHYTYIYHCDDCQVNQHVTWKVTIDGVDANTIDIVYFTPDDITH